VQVVGRSVQFAFRGIRIFGERDQVLHRLVGIVHGLFERRQIRNRLAFDGKLGERNETNEGEGLLRGCAAHGKRSP
jgi:hypothetical protein